MHEHQVDILNKRPSRPRHQDPFWMQCFTAAIAGASHELTPAEVVTRASAIADEAAAAVRQPSPERPLPNAQPMQPPPRERHSPGHLGSVKPAKTS